ncbi:hypothetical protein MNBD_GAMMA06-67 [hydrothermal vent metagenome]|uniref:Glycosyltransferase 2-like domain-containing protein n=1 Tax=hydrothermal vent metagenome TaxID=652676 RepID=A0A3B0W2N9_9ZZZZ
MSKAPIKISIIIPVLNEEAILSHINEHLQSIKEQGHEVIIVDGGSTDNTLMMAQEITDRVVISKAGRALQMNNGAAIASGKILLFLHVDTFLPDNTIQIILDNYQKESYRRKNYWGRFDVRLSSSKYVYRLIEGFMNLRSCITSIATGDQAIFIEKNLFNKVGQFPEIVLMEDIAISRQLKKIAKPVCIKQKVVSSSRRWENNGVVATVLLMWKLRLYYFFGVSPKKLNQLYY